MKNLLVFLLILLGVTSTDSLATLKLTCPKGGENFVAGSDTLITWEGILPTDTVKLEYSIDKGLNWQLITDKATGLQYVWKNVPKPVSNSCLVKIKPNVKGDSSRFEPAIEWQKTYGGSKEDITTAIQQTSDGGYIVAGYTESKDGDISNQKGNGDVWVFKLNKLGNIEWEKTYGGSGYDAASSIQQTFEGGYIVGGVTMSKDGDVSDNQGYIITWIVKLDIKGNIEWERTYGTEYFETAFSIQQTKDEGYIIATQKTNESHHLILKLDKKGDFEWKLYFVNEVSNYLVRVIQTTDHGFIAAGWTWKPYPDKEKYWIVKLDSLGNNKWEKTYGGSKIDEAYSIQQTKDDGYFVIGSASSADGDVTNNKGLFDCWVLKINQAGNMEWQKNYGGSKNDFAFSGQQTIDGGFILAGKTQSTDGDFKNNKYSDSFWSIIKIDEFGTLEWQKTISGAAVNVNYKNSIQQTTDGGYVMAGTASGSEIIPGCVNHGFSDFYVVKLGPALLTDQSDSVFSIIAPQAQVHDIDIKKCFLGSAKDSLISNFVSNTGDCKFRVDSIYFSGADKDAFKLMSAFPKYNLAPGESKATNIGFTPNRIGLHTATIHIITQTDTLIRNIQGTGVAQLFVTIKNDSAYAGDIRRLKLIMSGLKPEVLAKYATNFSAKIRFQKTILTALKKSERNVVNDSIYMNINGTICASYELAQILVIAGLGNVEETTIDIVDFKVTDNSGNIIEDVDIETESGVFKLLGICREGGTRLINPTGKAEILSIIPNPASDIVEIKVYLIEKGISTIEIYNSNGIKLFDVILNAQSGLQTINLDLKNYDSGLYFIKLHTPTVIDNEKLMIVK